MKENSIEEDKEILENVINTYETYNEMPYKFNTEIILAIEHILSDYKRVLKENEEWKETYKSEKKMKNEYVKLYQDLFLKENVIPIKKVKDKIIERQFELQQEYKDFEDDLILLVLQKLLEGRK